MSAAYERDSRYYYEDGSIVFLVENVLFKIQISRLAESEVFEDMLKCPVGTGDKEGSCDEDPVPLPDITAEQFRNLLFLYYGSPVSLEYRSLLGGVQTTDADKKSAFKRYQDIASLAHRYEMRDTEQWARGRIQDMISSDSAIQMDLGTLFETLSYAKIVTGSSGDDQFERDVRNLIKDIIYECVEAPSTNKGDISTILEIYQTRPQGFDLSVYGFIFICILGLGHESPEWARLTQAQEDILYRAQVKLTPLPKSLPFEPLDSVSSILGSLDETGQPLTVCSPMSRSLVWTREDWNSDRALEGIRILYRLPSKRSAFAASLKSRTCSCSEQCSRRLLAKIDEKLDALFIDLGRFPERIAGAARAM